MPCPSKYDHLATASHISYNAAMTDDAHIKLRERFSAIGERALARLHEIHPHLKGKSLEETVATLKAEEVAARPAKLSKSEAATISSIERLLALRQ